MKRNRFRVQLVKRANAYADVWDDEPDEGDPQVIASCQDVRYAMLICEALNTCPILVSQCGRADRQKERMP